jgi:subtilisin-like proprotein convertase family protein
MKPFLILVSALVLGHAAATAAVTETYTKSLAAVIPDADLSGIVQTLNVTSSGLASIDSLTVQLETTGGWNGDLYAYLWHDGIISVLVNRPGRSVLQPDGSPTAGMNLTLSDIAAIDLHLATGALNGTYQPDGRNVHPLTALDTDARTTPLSLFTTASPNGNWRLFIADVAGGEEATLVSWSITMTGQAVPEPSSALLAGFATLTILLRRRR